MCPCRAVDLFLFASFTGFYRFPNIHLWEKVTLGPTASRLLEPWLTGTDVAANKDVSVSVKLLFFAHSHREAHRGSTWHTRALRGLQHVSPCVCVCVCSNSRNNGQTHTTVMAMQGYSKLKRHSPNWSRMDRRNLGYSRKHAEGVCVCVVVMRERGWCNGDN